MSPSNSYLPLQRQLHWLVFLIVGIQYLSQQAMQRALENLESVPMDADAPPPAIDAWGFLIISAHTWGGALVGVLMLYRVYLRRVNPVAVADGQPVGLVVRMGGLVHAALYLVVLGMVLTGVAHYYLELPLAARWHELGKWLLAALLGLHILAALWHHLVRRDAVLTRMLVGPRQSGDSTDRM